MDQAMSLIAQWYSAYEKHEDVGKVLESQIRRFLEESTFVKQGGKL